MSNDLAGVVLNDRYQITKHLGAGGFGVVLQAYDHLLDREVAVKLIQPGYALAPAAVDAFLREARAVARLDHPNIVTVYDLGVITTEDWRLPFLVMQLAAGGSLADRLRTGPLSLPEARRVLTAVCDALDYAHSRGIIHLDLKPLNILFDKRDSPLVADFGLAKMLERATKVKADTRAGTLAYMAPEQLFGADAGPFTDVYALGITLYEMLTSELPRRSWDGAVQFDRVLPDDVLATLQAATQTDPGRRFSSVGALAQALSQTIDPQDSAGSHIGQVLEEDREMNSDSWSLPTVSEKLSSQESSIEIVDTRINDLKERFLFESEELPEVLTEIAAIQAGGRLPRDQYLALLDRATNLRDKDQAIREFWHPPTHDAQAIQRRDEAHEILNQMLTPVETLNRNTTVQMVLKDGEIVGQKANWKAVKEAKSPVHLSYMYRDAQRIGQVLATIQECECHLFEGKGIAFARPADRDGNPQNLIFVGATPDLPTYTVIDQNGQLKWLPFTTPATNWQIAALMLMGHTIEIVMDDPKSYNRHIFNQQVVDGFAKTQFINRFGNLVLPYERREFWEARIGKPKFTKPQALLHVVPPPSMHSKRPAATGHDEPGKTPVSYFDRGLIRANKGDLDGAIADWTEAIRLAPESPGAYFNRGLAWANEGDLDGAIADWTQVIRLAPESTDAYYNRGLARAETGDLDGAIADFTVVVQFDPRNAEAFNSRGVTRADKGDLDGAIADYTKAIRLNPKDAKIYTNRGADRAEKGDLDGAIADYTEAIQLDPDYAPAYYNRGNAREKMGDLHGAFIDHTQAIRLNPRSAMAYYNRGNVRARDGDLNGAIGDYTGAIRLDPQDPEAYVGRSAARGRLGDVDGAIADCDEAIQLNPQYADAYNNRGIGYQKKGALDRAIDDFTEAIQLNPLHAEAYGNRGLARADKGDLDGAIADFTEVIRLHPQTAPAYLNRGNFRARRGDLDGAIADFTEVLRLTPQHAYAYASRGFARYEKGDSGGAVADLEAYLKLSGGVSDDLREQVDQVLRELKGNK